MLVCLREPECSDLSSPCLRADASHPPISVCDTDVIKSACQYVVYVNIKAIDKTPKIWNLAQDQKRTQEFSA